MQVKLDLKTNSHLFYLHPTVSSVHVFIANLKLVAALCNKVFHPFEELVVIIGAEKVTTEKKEVEVRIFPIFTAKLFGFWSPLSTKRSETKKAVEGGKANTLLPHPFSLPLLLLICVLLPANMHLHRVEGVGCHDPRCHSEHNLVCENGRLRDVLSTREKLVFCFFFPPLGIYSSRNMTYNVYAYKKRLLNGKEIM